MRKWVALFCVLALLLTLGRDQHASLMGNSADITMPKIDESLAPLIRCRVGQKVGIGTGTVVSDKLMFTASHVIDGAKTCTVERRQVMRDTTETLIVIRDEPSHDIALLRGSLGPKSFEVSCTGFLIGQTYYMAGRPYGGNLVVVPLLATNRYVTGTPTIGLPTIEHLRVLIGATHPGMSGGPVVDDEGRVVGIVSSRPTNGVAETMAKELADTFVCADK